MDISCLLQFSCILFLDKSTCLIFLIKKFQKRKKKERMKEEEKRKNEGRRGEIIKEKYNCENSNQYIDEWGVYDFYPNVSQNSILSSLRTSTKLFNSINTLLCHLQSPELVLFFSEDTSCCDYQKFRAIIEKYHGIRSQIHSLNESSPILLNKAVSYLKIGNFHPGKF